MTCARGQGGGAAAAVRPYRVQEALPEGCACVPGVTIQHTRWVLLLWAGCVCFCMQGHASALCHSVHGDAIQAAARCKHVAGQRCSCLAHLARQVPAQGCSTTHGTQQHNTSKQQASAPTWPARSLNRPRKGISLMSLRLEARQDTSSHTEDGEGCGLHIGIEVGVSVLECLTGVWRGRGRMLPACSGMVPQDTARM